MKEEIKNKLENMEASDKLEQEVISYIVESFDSDDEIKNFFEDLQSHGCISGMVGHLIYYKDTNDFFDKYEEEIENLITESMENMDIQTRPLFIESLNGSAESISQEKNLLAWFGFEETAYKLFNRLGLDD